MKTLLLLAAITSIGSAADLKLTTGEVYKDYRILSQTPTTVIVRHAGGAVKIEKSLLPADVLAKFPIDEKAVNAEAAEVAKGREAYGAQVKAQREKEAAEYSARVEKNKARASREAELEQARLDGRRAAELAAARAKGSKEVAAAEAAQKRKEALIESHNNAAMGEIDAATEARLAALVRDRASEYFKAEYKQPASGLTLEAKTTITEIRRVPGYNDRYEVSGRTLTQAVESKGGFNATTTRFEAEVRMEKGRLQVVSLAPR